MYNLDTEHFTKNIFKNPCNLLKTGKYSFLRELLVWTYQHGPNHQQTILDNKKLATYTIVVLIRQF